MPISRAREKFARIVDEIDGGVRPALSVIKDGASKVVIISTAEYEALVARRDEIVESMRTLMGLKAGLADLAEGRDVGSDKARERLARRLKR